MKLCFFIFGFGYTAKALASQLILDNIKVIGTSRTPYQYQTHDPLIKLIHFDAPDLENHLKRATHLLISIPPTSEMDDLVLIKYRELIKKQAPYLQWMGYLSSTSVYGDHHGDWVDENSLCIPHTPTGIARLKAEESWRLFATEHLLPLHIFRLSGIYGPGRNTLERLMAGKKYSVFKEGQVFCRIHVEDIVSTLLASIQSPNLLSTYNVSDDEPAPAHVVDVFSATLLHQEPLPLIPFLEAPLSPMEKEFYASNRRVSNLKIKKELNLVLKYPTYREGLTDIWRHHFAS